MPIVSDGRCWDWPSRRGNDLRIGAKSRRKRGGRALLLASLMMTELISSLKIFFFSWATNLYQASESQGRSKQVQSSSGSCSATGVDDVTDLVTC